MSELNDKEVHALHEALDDEYHAWAVYDQVVRDFGVIAPFAHIRDAEARHIEALIALFTFYGQPVPDNPWPGKSPHYTSPEEACAAAVAAEIANGAMYVRLLAATDRPDLRLVFRNLQEASQQRHLPAFQRCAQGGASGGRRFRGGRGA
jgi:hypothetical protein